MIARHLKIARSSAQARRRALRNRPRRPPGAWSRAELRTLARIAEAMLAITEPDASAIARSSAERMDRHLDRAQVDGFRAVLRLLELPLVGAMFGGAARPFGRLNAAERERELRRWATSRWLWRRAAFQACKRIVTLFGYVAPTVAGRPTPLRAGTGYVPPIEPVTTSPTRIAALRLADVPQDATIDLHADVVVVGSGAGGGVVARDVAVAGRAVLLLEAGPLVLEPDMPVEELAAYDRLFLDAAVTGTWEGSMTIVAGRCVGGGTTVNWTSCMAPPASVRAEWARTHGISGFDEGQVDRDLAALQAELGFDPPPDIPPKDRLILDGAAALRIEAEPMMRNARDCGDCGSCGFGCRRGAKRSTLRVHLAEAAAAGARILPDAEVRRVTTVDGRVTGVEAIASTATGRRRVRVHAGQVVIAGGALRTPAILERSGVDHPAIGRYLRLHPVALLAALMRDPVEMWRGTLQAAHSIAWGPGSPGATGHAGFAIESIPGHLGLMAVAMPWRSSAEFRALMQQARFVAPVIAITRDAGWGTVRQTRRGRARIEYRLTPAGVTTLRAGLAAAAEIARAGGAGAILAPGEPSAWFARPGSGVPGVDLPADASDWGVFRRRLEAFDYGLNRGVVLSAHQLGSARMGADAADHPVDPDGHVRAAPSTGGRDRAIRGLYVADGSLFPTGLGVNPMVTIMLLARRVGRTVLAEGAHGGSG